MQIDMLVAEGSRVTALLTFSSGTVPNNDATAVWTATSIMEFAGGLVVKTWVNSDALSALTQLGAPPPRSHPPGDICMTPGDSCTPRHVAAPCHSFLVVDANFAPGQSHSLARGDSHSPEAVKIWW